MTYFLHKLLGQLGRITAVAVACTVLAGGCRSGDRQAATDRIPAAASGVMAADAGSASPALDASPRVLRQLGVRVFTLDVPRGRVSGNAEFWRRIDEQTLDPGVYDVLWANGVRVGSAPLSEIEHLGEVLDVEEAPVTDIVARSVGRQSHELPLRQGVDEQTLFWFDAGKRSHGQTFQRCENLLVLGFGPTPGRQTTMRLSLTPMVRSAQPRQVVTPSGDSYEVTTVHDENLFDLQLKTDVPLGHFLVVAPSDQLAWETCLGRVFFTHESEGELWERVYVIIPRVVALRTQE